jgi:hypothetical protein
MDRLHEFVHGTGTITDSVLLSPGLCRKDKLYLEIDGLEAVRYSFDLVPL